MLQLLHLDGKRNGPELSGPFLCLGFEVGRFVEFTMTFWPSDESTD